MLTFIYTFIDDQLVPTPYDSENSTSFYYLRGLTDYKIQIIAYDETGLSFAVDPIYFTTENKVYNGSLSIETQTDADEFGEQGYTEVEEQIFIGVEYQDSDIQDISSFLGLRKARERVLIRRTSLTSLRGLDSLTLSHPSPKIELWKNHHLTQLADFNNLNYLRYLSIKNSPLLVSLNGLDELEEINELYLANLGIENLEGLSGLNVLGKLNVVDMNNMTSLDGISQLSEIGYIGLNGLVLDNLSSLNNLQKVNQDFNIENSSILSLTGLENLNSVGGLYFAHIDNLQSVSPLNNLVEVEYDFTLQFMPDLQSLEGIGGVVLDSTYPDHFTIRETGISSLDGLNGFSMQNGTLQIWNNTSLTDLYGLTYFVENSHEDVDYFIQGNAYNPNVSDIQNGNCSQ